MILFQRRRDNATEKQRAKIALKAGQLLRCILRELELDPDNVPSGKDILDWYGDEMREIIDAVFPENTEERNEI